MASLWLRLYRHFLAAYWGARRHLSPAVLKRIADAVAAAEQGHLGEICVVVEASLTPLQLWQRMDARERALEVFAQARVWDTEHNSGVLVYVLLGDHAVEIISDRGLRAIAPADWDAIVACFQAGYASADSGAGGEQAIARLGALLRRHLPASGPNPDELPDPVRLL